MPLPHLMNQYQPPRKPVHRVEEVSEQPETIDQEIEMHPTSEENTEPIHEDIDVIDQQGFENEQQIISNINEYQIKEENEDPTIFASLLNTKDPPSEQLK